MACESDKCEKYGMHHDYIDGEEIRKYQFCRIDYFLESGDNLGHDFISVPLTDEVWYRNCGEEDHIIRLTMMRCPKNLRKEKL